MTKRREIGAASASPRTPIIKCMRGPIQVKSHTNVVLKAAPKGLPRSEIGMITREGTQLQDPTPAGAVVFHITGAISLLSITRLITKMT